MKINYYPETDSLYMSKVEGMSGEKMQDYFWEKGRLRPRSVGDEYGVRQSTCIYNNEKEIDRTLALAREMVGIVSMKE